MAQVSAAGSPPDGAGPAVPRMRLLCLHGYHGSAGILRAQMKPLFASLEPMVEPVCIDAPSRATGDFGWWHQDFRGWERTRDWLTGFFAEQPHFDGVFGFSQGAALTALLVGLRTVPGAADEQGPLSFEFAIMAGGFRSDSPRHAGLYARRPSYELPSLHLIGNADSVVPKSDSQALARQFTAPVVLEHPGGHVIASSAPVRARVTQFCREMARRKAARG
jgi:pimeloyl-ACP methyl ester carboxylesterase